MKLTCAALLFSFLFFSPYAIAQKNDFSVLLRTGAISAEPNLRSSFVDSFNLNVPRYHNKTIVVLRFETIPSEEVRKLLLSNGVELLDYVSQNTYTAGISLPLSLSVLQKAKAGSLMQLKAQQKIDPLLKTRTLPGWIIKMPGTVDVCISFPKSFSSAEVIEYLKEKNLDIVADEWVRYGKLSVRVAANRLAELASYPIIEYVEPVAPEMQPLNYNSRSGSRADFLNAAVADGGLGLNGEGVVIGIGDNTSAQSQIDFAGRLIERNTSFQSGHGIHVMGTAAGAGIVNELYRGYAPKSGIVGDLNQRIFSPVYVQDYNMVLTNNSYGGSSDCNYNGNYESTSQVMDKLAFDFPHLLNVFAVGNSGLDVCNSYPPGFQTALGWYQSAKNILSVGATNDSGVIAGFSSKGPVKDGRIKPEIVAMGVAVTSTWPDNIYFSTRGTSMAAPAVAGGLALLYQRYRQLNSGADPQNGLMKAILCNGATDKGNPGPDYTYGFGWMNLLRSVSILDKHHYFIASAGSNALNAHSITVPSGTAQLKVMLYWNDPAPSVLGIRSLVNDLDLEVVDPASSIVLPKILDTIPGNVNNVATNGIDHINNIEQVVVDNPVAGNYTFKVKGTTIAQNPSQEYYLVYDVIPVSLTLTYPVGGEGLVPEEPVKISWDAFGNNDKTFNLQFSTDNGVSWTDIATNIEAARRIYTWQVPPVVTSTALVRIVQNGSSLSSTSHAFTIIGVPVVSFSPVQCETYIGLSWTAIPGADDYEIMMLQGDEMKSAGTTTSTAYNINSLSKDGIYWVGVRARVNGKAGRRSVSVSRKPDVGTCSGSISDNDLVLAAIISPRSGRKYTSGVLTSSHIVTVQIKNLDDAPANNFTVQYSVNGGVWVSENVTATIAPGASYDHSFATTADLAALGNYKIAAVVKNGNADPVTANDTLVAQIRNLDNRPIDLSGTFMDDLESATPAVYKSETTGLSGIDRYDFESVSQSGQLNTFLNSGIAYSGTKSLVIGEIMQHNLPLGLNYLTGTFNLSNYSSSVNDLRLDFRYLHTAIGILDVWVRGADNKPWIKLFDITRSSDTAFRLSPSIEIADSLAAYGQEFSSSFQLRWSHSSAYPSFSKLRIYDMDDIRLYQVHNDVQLLKIDTPVAMSCNVTGNVPVGVRVHNSHHTDLNNIPIRYSVNGGPWIAETIASIPAKTTIQYTFSQPINMSAIGSYKLKVVVSYPSDSYRDNDTAIADIKNSPLVSSYPYLQNFESGTGGWYTDGQNSSWEYGTPSSSKIKGAASGAKAWKTRLSGNYNDNELSYLYSPCYQLSGMIKPVLSFSMAQDIEDCSQLCDGAWMEYTLNGTSWIKLNYSYFIINGYNNALLQIWNMQDYTRWHVVTSYSLPVKTGLIRFRFVFSSDAAINREGIAIDDFHVYDNNKGIYDSLTMAAPVTETVSGNNWIDFTKGGKLIASVQPNGQDLGTTNAQVYINSSAVRHTATQYYHDRNLVVKPGNRSLTDSVTLRFYFLDKETDTLINATGCPACARPSSAYELGISKYSDPLDSLENGSVGDNKSGTWSFINASDVVKVPFDKGYYAEFKVKGFSEFWLNNGGYDLNSHIALQLLSFTAQKAGNSDVLLNWKMGGEEGISRYEIELARGNAALQANEFIKIGGLPAQGSTTVTNYNFTDAEADKFGARYYRLKIIYSDGRFSYSPVRSVVFDEAVLWTVYPNPSTGVFYLVYQLNKDEKLDARLFDVKGSLLKEYHFKGNGFPQKFSIDLSRHPYAAGLYLLQLKSGSATKAFKLYKQ